jgi:hypothetical protein
VEADNYNVKKRRVLSDIPVRGTVKPPSPPGPSDRPGPVLNIKGHPTINNLPGLVFKVNPSTERSFCGGKTTQGGGKRVEEKVEQ